MRAQKQKGESLHSLMDVPTLYSQSRPIWAFYYARPTVRFVCLFLRNANVYNESWSGRDSASGPEAYLGACIEGLTIRRIVNLMLVKLINYILSLSLVVPPSLLSGVALTAPLSEPREICIRNTYNHFLLLSHTHTTTQVKFSVELRGEKAEEQS